LCGPNDHEDKPLRIGFQVQYAGDPTPVVEQVVAMEQRGLDIAWVAEAYGFDAVSILGYLAAKTERIGLGTAILNVYSRTPALLAQVAAGLDQVSQGRFELGLGASGPQVIEGWHGMPYASPIGRQREVVELVRRMLRREVIEHEGPNFTLPLPRALGTGLGKPLKMLTHPVRSEIPIHIASMGEKNVALTAEVADGWMPIFFFPEKVAETWGSSLADGTAKRSDELKELDTIVTVAFGIVDEATTRTLLDMAKPMYALYIGGMGAKGKNFYNDLACRYGYEQEAEQIQDLYLEGKKKEAAALIPDELVRMTNLIGDEGFVTERIEALRESGVTTLNILPMGDAATLIEQAKTMVS
jgi:F420-dependent oxidoreductase-like protein